jgi:hypothetical protein
MMQNYKGWVKVCEIGDRVMKVPNGMVLESFFSGGISLVFIPCTSSEYDTWLLTNKRD